MSSSYDELIARGSYWGKSKEGGREVNESKAQGKVGKG